jgi:hypothetical protein
MFRELSIYPDSLIFSLEVPWKFPDSLILRLRAEKMWTKIVLRESPGSAIPRGGGKSDAGALETTTVIL